MEFPRGYNVQRERRNENNEAYKAIADEIRIHGAALKDKLEELSTSNGYAAQTAQTLKYPHIRERIYKDHKVLIGLVPYGRRKYIYFNATPGVDEEVVYQTVLQRRSDLTALQERRGMVGSEIPQEISPEMFHNAFSHAQEEIPPQQ